MPIAAKGAAAEEQQPGVIGSEPNTLSGVADGSKCAAAESSVLSRSAASLTRLDVMLIAAESAATDSSSLARSADSEDAEW